MLFRKKKNCLFFHARNPRFAFASIAATGGINSLYVVSEIKALLGIAIVNSRQG
jgi:hypothetical protein